MSTPTQHTPGPWSVNGPQITAQGDLRSVVAVVLCQKDPAPYPDAAASQYATRDANARLIAAAPELLEALRDVMAEADFGDDELAQKCRAAIAKATQP